MADTSAPGGTPRRISWGNRILAPLALIVVVLAIVAIVSANSGNDSAGGGAASTKTKQGKSGGKGGGAENPKTYVIEDGDTLSGVAEKFGVSTKRLERLNPDIDPQTLGAGQELKIR